MASDGRDKELLREAIDLEAEGHRALLADDDTTAVDQLRAASDRYRASWEVAAPDAYGRLVGMIKAAVLAGEPTTAARYVHSAVGEEPATPTSAYALAIAAIVQGDDETAQTAAATMRGGTDEFSRAADGIAAIASADADACAAAVDAIKQDFAQRDEHLTGVPIADTALMLERLARDRGL